MNINAATCVPLSGAFLVVAGRLVNISYVVDLDGSNAPATAGHTSASLIWASVALSVAAVLLQPWAIPLRKSCSSSKTRNARGSGKKTTANHRVHVQWASALLFGSSAACCIAACVVFAKTVSVSHCKTKESVVVSVNGFVGKGYYVTV
jgi:hypothetical protein